jgi:hypothetical protein
MNEDIQFSNMDNWRGGSSGKFGLTFKQIVLQHINRCVVNGSVEWHGGYWNETGSNPTIRTYVQNSRDVYSNSVKMLRALLLGYFDKQIKEADKQLEEEFEKERSEYEKLEDKGKDIKYEFYSFKVNWHIKLFEQLIMLSKRLNFFEEETSEEEM